MRRRGLAVTVSLLLAGCGPGPLESIDGRIVDAGHPTFSAATRVTNPLFPMGELAQVVQLGVDGGRRLRVEVTLMPQTRVIEWEGQSVEAIVSQFISYRDGRILEVAHDYFAQADDGAVWYFGELVDNYADGRIRDHHGAWLAGEDGPPGMIMPKDPRVDDVYHPENIPGVVFEEVVVLETDVRADGPSGAVDGAIRVQEHLLEGTAEQKLFAPGYGEFHVEAANETLDVAVAVPTDLRDQAAPAALAELLAAARAGFEAAAAGDWSLVAAAHATAGDAWAQVGPDTIPTLLQTQMSDALDALGSAVGEEDGAATLRGCVAVGLAAVDVGLLFPGLAADLERLELWTRQAVADASDTAAVLGDVAVLETIWSRAGHTVEPATADRIVATLAELRTAADSEDLEAVLAAGRSLIDALGEVLSHAS